MPADNPLVGETWEMVDPVTGEAAQAVVAEIDSGAVRLIARLGRRLAMPRRSFLTTWHFVQEAPNHVCAHGTCENPGYLRVDDLGTWVLVCQDHLPAWVQPLLPTDDPENSSLDRCPLCRSSTRGSGSNAHEVEGVMLQHCGSCDCYWVSVEVESDEEDTQAAEFDRGVQLGEAIGDVTPLLEQRGLRVRGVIGQRALVALQRTVGGAGLSQENKPSFQGVELTVEPRLNFTLVLIGDRARTGIQRLGGTPGRQTPERQTTTLGVPERGTLWTALQGGPRVQINDVQISRAAGGPGQRMTVKAHTVEAPSREIEVGLQEFLSLYAQVKPEGASDAAPQKLRREPPPCEIGEEWISPEDKYVEVAKISETVIIVRHEEGLAQTIPTYIFRTRYRKAPPRRSVYQRLMDDD